MTVAVNVDGPDVVIVGGQEVHQGIVTNLEVESGEAGPGASVDEQRDLPRAGEGSFQASLVFLPQVDAQAVPGHVRFFRLNSHRARQQERQQQWNAARHRLIHRAPDGAPRLMSGPGSWPRTARWPAVRPAAACTTGTSTTRS